MTHVLITDTLQSILLKVKPEDFSATCQTNRQFAQACRNEKFIQIYRQRWYLDIRDKYTKEIIDPNQGFIKAIKIYNQNPTIESVALIDYFLTLKPNLKYGQLVIEAVIETGNHHLIDRFLPLYKSEDFYGLVTAAIKYIDSDPTVYQKVKIHFDKLFPERVIDDIFLSAVINHAIITSNLSLFNDYFDTYLHSEAVQDDIESILQDLIYNAIKGFAHESTILSQNLQQESIQESTSTRPWLDSNSASRQIYNQIASQMTEIPWPFMFNSAIESDNLDLIKWVWLKLTPIQQSENKQESYLGGILQDKIITKVEQIRSLNLRPDQPITNQLLDDPVISWILSLGISPSNIIAGRLLGGDSSALTDYSDQILSLIASTYWHLTALAYKNTPLAIELINRLPDDIFIAHWNRLLEYENLPFLTTILDRAQNLGLLRDQIVGIIRNIALIKYTFGNLQYKMEQLISKYASKDLITTNLISIIQNPFHSDRSRISPLQLKTIIDWISNLGVRPSIVYQLFQYVNIQADPGMTRYIALKLLPAGDYPTC